MMSFPLLIELDFGKVELGDDGILRFHASFNEDTITISELEELLKVLSEVTDGKQCPFYTDNSKMKSLGFEERQFIGKNLHRFASASAVKENSPVVRFIGHTINHLFPPKVPMKMFDTEDEAIDWLESVQVKV